MDDIMCALIYKGLVVMWSRMSGTMSFLLRRSAS